MIPQIMCLSCCYEVLSTLSLKKKINILAFVIQCSHCFDTHMLKLLEASWLVLSTVNQTLCRPYWLVWNRKNLFSSLLVMGWKVRGQALGSHQRRAVRWPWTILRGWGEFIPLLIVCKRGSYFNKRMRSEFVNLPQSSESMQPFKPMKSEADYHQPECSTGFSIVG